MVSRILLSGALWAICFQQLRLDNLFPRESWHQSNIRNSVKIKTETVIYFLRDSKSILKVANIEFESNHFRCRFYANAFANCIWNLFLNLIWNFGFRVVTKIYVRVCDIIDMSLEWAITCVVPFTALPTYSCRNVSWSVWWIFLLILKRRLKLKQHGVFFKVHKSLPFGFKSFYCDVLILTVWIIAVYAH